MSTHPDRFIDRHIGPRQADIDAMLETLSCHDLDELIARAVPAAIRLDRELALDPPMSEVESMSALERMAAKNEVRRSYIGMGYHQAVIPAVLRRNILENPGWYTQYTAYQAEIAQGRLEALLNFQTLIVSLTGLDVANASLLDEGTAAAEAMTLCHRVLDKAAEGKCFFVSSLCHPQTIAVVATRAEPLGIEVVVGDHEKWDFSKATFGALVQYPATDGEIFDYAAFAERAHQASALVVVAADLLALTLLRPPAEFGADVAIGSAQRFGLPLGFGGPHAAYMAVRDTFKRQMPGRLIGVSKDANGRPAYRLALQTREQHIRRDKATSNICTAQVLLAVMVGMYAVYHGPEGLRAIASRLRKQTLRLASALRAAGCTVRTQTVFDTLRVSPGSKGQAAIVANAAKRGINLRSYDGNDLGIALDESVGEAELIELVNVFAGDPKQLDASVDDAIPATHKRRGTILEHPVFHAHRSETEMLRYLKRLESRDLSLTTSMIPLGSCTMK